MPLAEAKALGAMALFGEVYGDIVRVVDMGEGWSRELCAGTHVAQTSQVGLLAVNAEASRRVRASAGSRRSSVTTRSAAGEGALAGARDWPTR